LTLAIEQSSSSSSSSSTNSSSLITPLLFQSVMEQQEKPCLSELLLHLSVYELQLYSVIARKQCQQLQNHNHVNPNKVSDGFREMTLDSVLSEFDRMTNNSITNKVKKRFKTNSFISSSFDFSLYSVFCFQDNSSEPNSPNDFSPLFHRFNSALEFFFFLYLSFFRCDRHFFFESQSSGDPFLHE
jgi:hypothetical protein